MDLPKILLTGLVCFFLVFLEFLDSWAWDSKNLEKNQINQKNQKKQSWMDLPKILLTGLFFFVFFVFFGIPRVFGQLGLGQQKPREKRWKPKNKKNNPEWTYPRFFSQDCFFVFFVFFGFPRVFGQLGLGTPKNLEKNDENQKTKKTIWNRLTPDSSHRIVFFVSFWFSLTFWAYGKVEMKKGKKHEKTKDAKTQRSQRPFLFFWGDYVWSTSSILASPFPASEIYGQNPGLRKNVFPSWCCNTTPFTLRLWCCHTGYRFSPQSPGFRVILWENMYPFNPFPQSCFFLAIHQQIDMSEHMHVEI